MDFEFIYLFVRDVVIFVEIQNTNDCYTSAVCTSGYSIFHSFIRPCIHDPPPQDHSIPFIFIHSFNSFVVQQIIHDFLCFLWLVSYIIVYFDLKMKLNLYNNKKKLVARVNYFE